MTDTFRCSDAARERGDPMLGTAPPQPRLLLVQTPRPWSPNALLALPAEVRDEISSRAEAAQARVLLIRRPGARPVQTPPWCWYAVDPLGPPGGRVMRGTWNTGQDLVQAAVRLQAMVRDHHGGSAADEPSDEELVLVCTHGRKDVCCAVRGRPVAAALSREWPAATWECSHTGGDRFAANVIVLPDGACYGGLDADTAVRTVLRHRQGRPDGTLLRGRIGDHRLVQCAVVDALTRWQLAWGAVRPLDLRLHLPLDGDEEPLGHDGIVGRWQVDVEVEGHRRWRAVGVERLAPARRLTCDAPRAGSVRVPEVTGWERLGAEGTS
ncbi:sucrase ferredoxin [Serinicoccus kebangsaanensis]|uniref:sucrase ferredoxin n=1 Tax=Serinicoccus kebangsaanensis TaxID=2602069 RepID=UPI00124E9A07|nr:sucrase ferredoxin [Serinicoccus kebangsaanensis]